MGVKVPLTTLACQSAGWLGWADKASQRAQAAAQCAGCPLLQPCREAGETNRERFGVWGGVDRQSNYRRQFYAAPAAPRAQPACGTDNGYKAHRRRQEPACEPCKRAHAQAERRLKQARQALLSA